MKAFIERDGKILILRESGAYKGVSEHGNYVIPGGKVDEGEHFAEALKREVREECALAIDIGKPFHVDEWRIDIPDKPRHIVATYFHCRYKSGDVNLNGEFDSYEWIKPSEYKKYNINSAAQRAFVSYLNSGHTK